MCEYVWLYYKRLGTQDCQKVCIPSDLFWSHCMTLRDDGELGVARPRCCVFFFAQHHHIISCVVIKVACSGLTSGLLFISKEEAHTRGKKKTKQSLCSLMCHKLNNKSLFAPFGKKPPPGCVVLRMACGATAISNATPPRL